MTRCSSAAERARVVTRARTWLLVAGMLAVPSLFIGGSALLGCADPAAREEMIRAASDGRLSPTPSATPSPTPDLWLRALERKYGRPMGPSSRGVNDAIWAHGSGPCPPNETRPCEAFGDGHRIRVGELGPAGGGR